MGANFDPNQNLNNLRQREQQVNQELTGNRNSSSQTQAQQTSEVSRLDAQICQNFNKGSQVDQLVTNSQANQATAEGNLSTAQGNEATAQANSTTANDNLSTAQTNQSEAESASSEADAALSSATTDFNAAVSAANAAQTDYNTANADLKKAEGNLSAKQNENKSWWDKAKQAVKDAWNSAVNKLKSLVSAAKAAFNKAKDKLQTALGMKADKERCMKVAEGVSDEAKAKLEERKQECNKAQELADAAQVLLAAASGEVQVSEEELAAAIKIVQDAQAEKEQVEAEGAQLQGEKSAVQAQYDALLSQLSQAIAGNEVDLASIQQQIATLQAEIDSQNAQITMQEELAAQLGAQSMDLYARSDAEADTAWGSLSNSVGGLFGGGPNGDLEKLEEYKKELEAAIMSGDEAKLKEIYDKINDKSTTNEEFKALKEEAVNSNKFDDSLSAEDKEFIANELKKQADALSGKLDQSVDDQGVVSSFLGGLNNGLGFGTSENMSRAQIEEYQRQVDQLLKDLEEGKVDNFAARYKAITNESLTQENTYALTLDPEDPETVAAIKKQMPEGATDEDVRKAIIQAKDKTSNSRAAESIMDYESTQETMKDVTVGIAVGVASAAAVIAAPFTGGASLALGFAVGGLTKVGLEALDTVGSPESYSLKQGLLDFATGGIDGAMSAVTLGGAGLAGKGVKTFATSMFKSGAKATAKQAGKTSIKEAFKQGGKEFLKSGGKQFLKSGFRASLTAMGTTSAHYLKDTALTSALYDDSELERSDKKPVQNEDGTYTYELIDKATGRVVTTETVSLDENGKEVRVGKGSDFSWGKFIEQNAISGTTAFAGAGIGKISGNFINPFTTSATGSAALGNVFEIAADATLSLGTDYAIERTRCAIKGEEFNSEKYWTMERFTGEAQNQFRSLFIGIASAKANDVQAAGYTTAANMMSGGKYDTDAVRKTLTDSGVSTKDANKFIANDTAQKIITDGGDTNKAIKAMTDMGVSEKDAKSTVGKMQASTTAAKDFSKNGVDATRANLIEAGYSKSEANSMIKDMSVAEANKAISANDTNAAKKILTDGGYSDKAAESIISKSVSANEAKYTENSTKALDDNTTKTSDATGTDGKQAENKDVDLELAQSTHNKLTADGIDSEKAFEILNATLATGDLKSYEATYEKLKELGFEDAADIAVNVSKTGVEEFVNVYNMGKNVGMSENDAIFIGKNLTTAETTKMFEFAMQTGTTITEAFNVTKYPNSRQALEVELSIMKNNPEYKPVEGGMLDNIGKVNGIPLAEVPNLKENFEIINKLKYGERLDTSLENWTVKVGDTEVKIRTDNNVILEENRDKLPVTFDADKHVAISREDMKILEDALKQMTATGQKVPDEIFVSDFIGKSTWLGAFNRTNPDAITVRSQSLATGDVTSIQRVIFHESGHLSDWNLGNGADISNTKGATINATDKYVGTETNKIKAEDVKYFVSDYALTNPQEFVAEVTSLITRGVVRTDADGKYTIQDEGSGLFFNAKGDVAFYQDRDQVAIDGIMKLYNELTEGKLATPLKIGTDITSVAQVKSQAQYSAQTSQGQNSVLKGDIDTTTKALQEDGSSGEPVKSVEKLDAQTKSEYTKTLEEFGYTANRVTMKLASEIDGDITAESMKTKVETEIKKIKPDATDDEISKVIELVNKGADISEHTIASINRVNLGQEQTAEIYNARKGFAENCSNRELNETTLDAFNQALTTLGAEGSAFRNVDFEAPNFKLELEYPRSEFVSDVSKTLSNLSPEDRTALCKKFGFELIETDGRTILSGYPMDLDTKSIDPKFQNAAEQLNATVQKFNNNTITVAGSPELSAELTAIATAFPEFYTMVGKGQHSSHHYTTDVHTLKVLQDVVNNPAYKNLSQSDQNILKIATMFHDVTKIEGAADGGHATQGAIDTEYIIQRLGMSEAEASKVKKIVENHDWLQRYNTQENVDGKWILTEEAAVRNAQELANILGEDNIFEMSRILTEADLKGTKRDGVFFERFGDAYRDGSKRITENIELKAALDKAGVEVTKENLAAGAEIKKAGAEVTKENIKAKTALEKEGIPITKDNIELQKAGYSISSQNSKMCDEIRELGAEVNVHSIKTYETYKSHMSDLPKERRDAISTALKNGDINYEAAKVLACDVNPAKQKVSFETMMERASELSKNEFVNGKTKEVSGSTAWGTRAAHYANIMRLDETQYKRFNDICENKESNKIAFGLDDVVRLAESEEAYNNAINYKNAADSGKSTFEVNFDGKTYEIDTRLSGSSTISIIATIENYAKNAESFTKELAEKGDKLFYSLNETCKNYKGEEELFNMQKFFSLTETEYARAEDLLGKQADKGNGAIGWDPLMRIARDEANYTVAKSLFDNDAYKDLSAKDIEALSSLTKVNFNDGNVIKQITDWKKEGYSSDELRFGTELKQIEQIKDPTEQLFAKAELYIKNSFALGKNKIDSSKQDLSTTLEKLGMSDSGKYDFEKDYLETVININKIKNPTDLKYANIGVDATKVEALIQDMNKGDGTTKIDFDPKQIEVLTESESFSKLSPEEQSAFMIASQIKTEDGTFDPYQTAAAYETKLRAAGVDQTTAQNVRCILEEQYTYNKLSELDSRTDITEDEKAMLKQDYAQRIAIFARTEFKTEGDSFDLIQHANMLNKISGNTKTIDAGILDTLEASYDTVKTYNVNDFPQSSSNNFSDMESYIKPITRNGKTYNVKVIPVSKTVNSDFAGFVHGYGVTADGGFSDSSVLTDFTLSEIDPTRTTSTSYLANGNFNCDCPYGIVLEAGADELLSLTPFDASFPTRITIEDLPRFYFPGDATTLQGKTSLYANREYMRKQINAYKTEHQGATDAQAVKAILKQGGADQNLIVNQGSGFLNDTSYNEALIKGGRIKGFYAQKDAYIPDVYLELIEKYDLPILEMDNKS